MWGYALYRIHTKNFNFISFFAKGSKSGGRDRYEDLSSKSYTIITCIAVSGVLCLMPAINVFVGVIMVGGAFAIPAGQQFWGFLKQVGR